MPQTENATPEADVSTLTENNTAPVEATKNENVSGKETTTDAGDDSAADGSDTTDAGAGSDTTDATA